MTLLGSPEVAVGNALRSSKAMRILLASRHWVLRKSRITAMPPKCQLWHPTRGVSTSPTARSPNIVPQDAQALEGTEAAAAAMATVVKHEYTTAFNSEDLKASSLFAQFEPLPPPTRKRGALGSNTVTPNVVKIADKDVATILIDGKIILPQIGVADGPPVGVLPFKMVDDLFYTAKAASAGSTGSFWSYNQYRGKGEDGTEQKVKVHYCRSKHTMEKVCQEYFTGEKVLGFDLEWAADASRLHGLKKNVSLIQLASPSRIGLFHVALFSNKDEMVGPTFRAIMEDSGITKAGVSIKGDGSRLRNFLGIDSKGLLELSNLYKLVTYSAEGQYHKINRKLVPLATQVEHYLRLPLFKGQNVRSSDWTRPLSMAQVICRSYRFVLPLLSSHYLDSASDAYAGVQLYATLEHYRKQLDPCPPTPYHVEHGLPIRIADGIELSADEKSKSSRTRGKSRKKAPDSKDSRIEIAEDRVACYRAAHPSARASFVQLRAYYMWHGQGLDPQTIARLVRDPPLKIETIVGYILAAVQMEKFPVDTERLRHEIANMVPEDTLRSRWPSVAAAVTVSTPA
ncbi:hypothetical protein AAE478_004306 [Parahypoxylon ruwenzoriense]